MKLFTRKNALLLTAVIILLAAACAFALSREQKALFVSEPALAPSDERDFMSVSVEATGDLRTVKGSMCLTATNRTGEDLSEIVLRAYPNAIQQGSVTLYGAAVDGESVPVGMDSGDPSVWRSQTPWRAGETLEISWQAALIVPRGESAIGRTDESALLIGALPLPAVWENGAWRTDEYDELAETSYGQAVDIQMALTVPKTVLAAFGGAWIDEQDNGDGTKTLAMQLSGAREIAFAMRAEGEIRQTRAGDVLITALAENARTASRLREAAADALEAIEKSYADDVTDEFVVPCVTCEGGRVQEGDTVVFINFRPDRARQMTRIFVDDDFKGFERRYGRFPVHYVCMAEYDATMPNVEVAYPPVELTNVLGEYLAKNGKTQLRIAETEKYAHVTFFFNGGVEAPYEGEDRKVIPSPKVATYDLKPEMSAYEVADECAKRIRSGKYDVVILNFANCDMVGHTGVFDAAVKAVEAVDACVETVWEAVRDMGGYMFLTADHGNADKMENPDGTPFTAHTTNPVPFLVAGCGNVKLRAGGCLADIAPTMLPYIGLPVPKEMTGKSIIEE